MTRLFSALAGLLLAPVDRGAIYLSKLLTNLILMFGLALVVTPVARRLHPSSLRLSSRWR